MIQVQNEFRTSLERVWGGASGGMEGEGDGGSGGWRERGDGGMEGWREWGMEGVVIGEIPKC